ncbi:RNA-directed DNA polymerase, eukaryota, reverse transcriptase zinc-binding domain protein [Tanacetum coccineum]
MDIIKYVQNFNSPALLSRGCNSSFISLVPKVSNPLCILDYESISLIGCQYKIIAKILAERSKLVLSFVICKEQFTYLHVHQIIDGPLMVNEIISWVSHQRSKLMIFNVDFEKAFDTLNWIFLDDVMRQMGFALSVAIEEVVRGGSFSDFHIDLYGVGVARNGVDWMASTLNIRIWKDVWFGSLNLDQTYPRLFALALDKNCSVQQWVSASSKNHDLWRRDLFFSREIEELEILIV